MTDITERHHAAEALRASLVEFRTLAEAMPQSSGLRDPTVGTSIYGISGDSVTYSSDGQSVAYASYPEATLWTSTWTAAAAADQLSAPLGRGALLVARRQADIARAEQLERMML